MKHKLGIEVDLMIRLRENEGDLSNFRAGLSCYYKTNSGGGSAVQEDHITATGSCITSDVQGGPKLVLTYRLAENWGSRG